MSFEIFICTFRNLFTLLKKWSFGLGIYTLVAVGTGLLATLGDFSPAWSSILDFLGKISGLEFPSRDAAGWLNATGFSLFFPLLLGIFSVHVGSFLVAQEEENGRLALLLAYPLTRHRILMEKYAPLPAGLFLLVVEIWILLAAASLVPRFHLHLGQLALACLNAGLLALVFGTLAFTLGALSGKTHESRWISLAIATVFYALYRLPDILPQAGFLRHLSPLKYTLSDPPFPGGGLITGSAWLSLALILLLLFVAWNGFERRDLEI